MKSAHQYISKGFYKYSQISNFISVKNYMFIRQSGKKCLLLRFSNDMEYPVDSMEFTVVQLDSAGKVLTKTKIRLGNLNFPSGGTYTTQKGIVVDEYCSDFKILFREAYSGRYKYQVKDWNVTAYYLKEKTPIVEENASNKNDLVVFTVKPRRFGKPKLAVLVSVIVLLVIIALNLYDLFADRASYGYLDSGYHKSVITSEDRDICDSKSESFQLR